MLGIFLSILAAIFYGIATAIQKYSLCKMKKFSLKKMLADWRWLSSIAVTAVGGLCYLLALRFETLSTVQPMLSLTILIPVIFGVLFFKEKLRVIEWIGVVLLMIGIISISF